MNKGDFVKVSYTGWVEGDLIETTDEAVAKKAGAYNKSGRYSAASIVVGEGMVLPGIDANIEGMKVGESKKVQLKAKDAFGERSLKLIQLVPIRDFHKQNIKPLPGMVFEVEGRPAKIQSVSSGRVRVDFNHPLAGKDVEYEIRIESSAKTETEKVAMLLERSFRKESIKFTESGTGEKKKITVDIPDSVKADKLYQIMKMVFKVEAEKYLKIKDIEYNEPKEKKEATAEKKEAHAEKK